MILIIQKKNARYNCFTYVCFVLAYVAYVCFVFFVFFCMPHLFKTVFRTKKKKKKKRPQDDLHLPLLVFSGKTM